MILFILGIAFSILGLVGYYCNIFILLIISFVFIITETIMEIYHKELHNINTLLAATVIGVLIAIVFQLPIFNTIIVSLCYETLFMTLLSIAMMAITFLKSRSSNGNFGYIAQNVAMIYYVLNQSDFDELCQSEFGKVFTKEQKLYATAIIDLIPYFTSKGLSLSDALDELADMLEDDIPFVKFDVVRLGFYSQTHGSLFDVANFGKVIESSHKELLNIAMQIEAYIFALETNIDKHMIVDIVIGNKEVIAKTIDKTMAQGTKCNIYSNVCVNIMPIIMYPKFQQVVFSYKEDMTC